MIGYQPIRNDLFFGNSLHKTIFNFTEDEEEVNAFCCNKLSRFLPVLIRELLGPKAAAYLKEKKQQ